LLHELIVDLLHPIDADDAGDLGHVRVDPWRLAEERLEVDVLLDLLLQRWFIVAGEPVDDGMHLLLRTTLLFRLGDVMRVDARERHSEYSRVIHGLVAPQRPAPDSEDRPIHYQNGARPGDPALHVRCWAAPECLRQAE